MANARSNSQFVPPLSRLMELRDFANTGSLGRLFKAAPDVVSGQLSETHIQQLHHRTVRNLCDAIYQVPIPEAEKQQLVGAWGELSMHGVGFDFEKRTFLLQYDFPRLESQLSCLTLLVIESAGRPVFPGTFSRCKACKKFYFAESAGGRMNRTYCSDKCADKGGNSTPRTRKFRRHK